MSEPTHNTKDESTAGVEPVETGSEIRAIPEPTADAGRRALRAILSERSVLPALSVFHEELGDVFQISLGSFRPVFMVGPDAVRFMLVTARDQLLWRPEHDPVTQLLRNGLLVTDGEKHDWLRGLASPSLHRTKLDGYAGMMCSATDRIIGEWPNTGTVDMLVEMRRVALLIVMETLFRVDILPDLDRLLPAILDILRYISPGLWTVWPGVPRPGYGRSIDEMDAYLYGLIADRRSSQQDGNRRSDQQDDDMLTHFVNTPGMSDDLIRDQMLTLLIAGHDTSTALLAWTLTMLGKHPDIAQRVQDEVDDVVGQETPTLENVSQLTVMEQVLNETLRLYPPIHLGNRIAATEIRYQDFVIPAGTRVVYSIYLTHRHPEFWADPHRFDPDRFGDDENRNRVPYSYLPFGSGKRNCIGAAFAQIEAKVILSRILQRYDIKLKNGRIHPHMGATLEPRPGVKMDVRLRHAH